MQEFTDEYEEYYGDEPEGVWAKCDKCDTLMEYSSRLEKFRCPCCGKEIDEDEYEEYYDDDNPPFGCSACGGPYPLCKEGCNMFDD